MNTDEPITDVPDHTSNILHQKLKKIIITITNFYKRHIKIWSTSIGTLILFIIIGFTYGIVLESKFNLQFYTNDGNVLLFFSLIVLISSVIHIFYKRQCKLSGTIYELDNKSFKTFFYSFSFVCFAIYYNMNKTFFSNTYSQNKFGIDQSQYILIINFIGYFLILTLIYTVLFKNYSLKKLGKDGIEF
jgi:membrane protease YdiL (CAAX protease family)